MEQRSFNEGELQIKEIMHSEQKRSKVFVSKLTGILMKLNRPFTNETDIKTKNTITFKCDYKRIEQLGDRQPHTRNTNDHIDVTIDECLFI